MKPLLYNVHDEIVKQAAGHVTGKAGLDSDLVALNQLDSVVTRLGMM
ncbi:MAG TPA: hypothetical protein VIY67_05260 [Nitrospiraceae bacterium]